MNRSSGVLLPIFSLPGPYGIGSIGTGTGKFAEKLVAAGFRYWQVLPCGHTGAGNSPYQSFSAFAGNPYLIDLDQLADKELLTKKELDAARYSGSRNRIDYGWLWQTRSDLLHLAFSRLDETIELELVEFINQQQHWLIPYANFLTLKQHHDFRPWWEWSEPLKMAEDDAVNNFISEHQDTYNYYCFLQFAFYRQWQKSKAKINQVGIQIIGDLPFYPATDSVEVWSRPDLFELDESKTVIRVSGVPPDYFSTTGQLWNNPVYDWDKMAQDNYRYWHELLSATLYLYDVVRLDHFRGFESYWAVPAGAETAAEGRWEKGPGLKLFEPLLQAFPAACLLAEDLGEITSDVRNLLTATGLPGMKVLQFAFDPDSVSRDRPHHYPQMIAAFTGTHDNNTLMGWLHGLEEREWELVRDYFGLREGSSPKIARENLRNILRTLWQSQAGLVICPVQDLLGLGSEYRINTPGCTDNNWLVRMTDAQLDRIDTDWFKRLNEITQRTEYT